MSGQGNCVSDTHFPAYRVTIDPFLSRKCHQPGDRLGRILGLRQCWSPGKTFLACVFSHRIVKASGSQCQGLWGLCVSGLFISDYIPPRTPARLIHKASIHGLWQGFHGNCRVRGTVIVSADKTHSLTKEASENRSRLQFQFHTTGY